MCIRSIRRLELRAMMRTELARWLSGNVGEAARLGGGRVVDGEGERDLLPPIRLLTMLPRREVKFVDTFSLPLEDLDEGS